MTWLLFTFYIMAGIVIAGVLAYLVTVWAWSAGWQDGYQVGRASMEDHNDR